MTITKACCVFTIVAKNYIGLARILGETLHRHDPGVDFRIFVADEFEPGEKIPNDVIVAHNALGYQPEQWRDMSFKYDLTEFCTSIKPAAFQKLFADGYERVIYFDPDIYIYSSVRKIFELLATKDFVLTPQIDGIHTHYAGEHPEWHMNVNGIFNLGFCGVRRSAQSELLLAWWREKLVDNAFSERTLGQFTDQKWMDWIPGLDDTDSIHILRDLGMNLAPWNFFERKVERDDKGDFYVSYRCDDGQPTRRDRLVFLHYSGYDYSKLKQGVTEHQRMSLTDYPDLREVVDIYGRTIKENAATFDSYIDRSYSYGTFADGSRINSFHRRLYHGLDEAARLKTDPFATGAGTYHEQLKRRGMIVSDAPGNFRRDSVGDMDGKKRLLGRFYRLLYRLLGFSRYAQFVKSLRFYALPEEHTFLINQSEITR